MHITLNGEEHELPTPMSVSALLEKLELEPRKIAVERNLEIVPRSAYETTIIDGGDRLEIVQFVGGG
ncbi:MAG: sulfur carrier protein ThiS [Pseudomonadota bacterium]